MLKPKNAEHAAQKVTVQHLHEDQGSVCDSPTEMADSDGEVIAKMETVNLVTPVKTEKIKMKAASSSSSDSSSGNLRTYKRLYRARERSLKTMQSA